jgi:tRNA pseudouridine38-40 synthase
MVRRMVGSMVATGRGLISLDEFEAIIRSADLAQNSWMAPPQGLVLVDVRYPQPGEASPRKQKAPQSQHAN